MVSFQFIAACLLALLVSSIEVDSAPASNEKNQSSVTTGLSEVGNAETLHEIREDVDNIHKKQSTAVHLVKPAFSEEGREKDDSKNEVKDEGKEFIKVRIMRPKITHFETGKFEETPSGTHHLKGKRRRHRRKRKKNVEIGNIHNIRSHADLNLQPASSPITISNKMEDEKMVNDTTNKPDPLDVKIDVRATNNTDEKNEQVTEQSTVSTASLEGTEKPIKALDSNTQTLHSEETEHKKEVSVTSGDNSTPPLNIQTTQSGENTTPFPPARVFQNHIVTSGIEPQITSEIESQVTSGTEAKVTIEIEPQGTTESVNTVDTKHQDLPLCRKVNSSSTNENPKTATKNETSINNIIESKKVNEKKTTNGTKATDYVEFNKKKDSTKLTQGKPNPQSSNKAIGNKTKARDSVPSNTTPPTNVKPTATNHEELDLLVQKAIRALLLSMRRRPIASTLSRGKAKSESEKYGTKEEKKQGDSSVVLSLDHLLEKNPAKSEKQQHENALTETEEDEESEGTIEDDGSDSYEMGNKARRKFKRSEKDVEGCKGKQEGTDCRPKSQDTSSKGIP